MGNGQEALRTGTPSGITRKVAPALDTQTRRIVTGSVSSTELATRAEIETTAILKKFLGSKAAIASLITESSQASDESVDTPTYSEALHEIHALNSMGARVLSRKLFNGISQSPHGEVLQGATILLDLVQTQVPQAALQEDLISALTQHKDEPKKPNVLALLDAATTLIPSLPKRQQVITDIKKIVIPAISRGNTREDRQEMFDKFSEFKGVFIDSIVQKYIREEFPKDDKGLIVRVLKQKLEIPDLTQVEIGNLNSINNKKITFNIILGLVRLGYLEEQKHGHKSHAETRALREQLPIIFADMTPAEISAHFNITIGSVYSAIKDLGLTKREETKEFDLVARSLAFDKLVIGIVRDPANKNTPFADILTQVASAFGKEVSPSALQATMRRLHLPIGGQDNSGENK